MIILKKKISELDISDKMKLKIINKEIHESRRDYIERLIKNDPQAYLELRKSQKKDIKRFQKKNPGYIEKWRKKNPEKYNKYTKTNYRKRKKIRERKE